LRPDRGSFMSVTAMTVCQPCPTTRKPSQPPPTFVRDLKIRSNDVVNAMVKLQPQHAKVIHKIMLESREDLSTFCKEVRRQIGGTLLFDAVMMLRGVQPSPQGTTQDAKSLYEHAVGCRSPSCSRHGCLALRSIFSQLRQHAQCCSEPDGCNPCMQYQRIRNAMQRAKAPASATSVMLVQPVTLAKSVNKPTSSTNQKSAHDKAATPATHAPAGARGSPGSVAHYASGLIARGIRPRPPPPPHHQEEPASGPKAASGASGLLLLAKALGIPQDERMALSDGSSPGQSPVNSPLPIRGHKQPKLEYAHSVHGQAVHGRGDAHGLVQAEAPPEAEYGADSDEDNYSAPVYAVQDSASRSTQGERRPHRQGLKHRCKRCGQLKKGHVCLAMYREWD